jgi:hypothetical protein
MLLGACYRAKQTRRLSFRYEMITKAEEWKMSEFFVQYLLLLSFCFGCSSKFVVVMLEGSSLAF